MRFCFLVNPETQTIEKVKITPDLEDVLINSTFVEFVFGTINVFIVNQGDTPWKYRETEFNGTCYIGGYLICSKSEKPKIRSYDENEVNVRKYIDFGEKKVDKPEMYVEIVPFVKEASNRLGKPFSKKFYHMDVRHNISTAISRYSEEQIVDLINDSFDLVSEGEKLYPNTVLELCDLSK